MSIFTKAQQDYIDRLAMALRDIEITETEMTDMRLLYKCTNGIPFHHFDERNRPRGPTIRSSSTLGSKVKRATGAPARYYGMNIVGHSGDGANWYMNDEFRAAIDKAKIFGPSPVVPDETTSWDDDADRRDEEGAIVGQIRSDESLTETEREQLILARIGHGEFRLRVQTSSPTCRVTGVADGRFLIASHIKPWRVCSNFERLDGYNGLMLSPHIDKIFDKGYISFEDDGSLIVSSKFPIEVLEAWPIDTIFNAGKLNEHQSKYMAFHREHVFLGTI